MVVIKYNSQKEAIASLSGLNSSDLKKINSFGMENDGIYSYRDRIFKVSSSHKEFLVANLLIGHKFENVVKVYNSQECDVLGKHGVNYWRSYIIEEEKLERKGKSFAFNNFEIQNVCADPEKRIPYYASILNGLAELASIGIIYYDLHPLNVMYNDKGQVKIIDFGCASIKRTAHFKKVKVSYQIEDNLS